MLEKNKCAQIVLVTVLKFAMPTLLRLTSRVLVHGPRRAEEPFRREEGEKEGGKTGGGMKKKEGRGKRRVERNEGMRITRRKWMVGRNGM